MAAPPPPHTHVPGSGCCDLVEATAGGVSLLPYIDVPNVRCLNAAGGVGAGRAVLKAMDRRRSRDAFLDSQAGDPELLLHIPFTCTVRIRSLCVSGEEGGRTPDRVRLFKERPALTFDDAQASAAVQEVALAHADSGADTWHPLKVAKFSGVSSLQLHFTGSGGAEDVRLFFVGLKGDVEGHVRTLPANLVYEARPQAGDHAVPEEERLRRAMGT
jgi:hypothetical protein